MTDLRIGDGADQPASEEAADIGFGTADASAAVARRMLPRRSLPRPSNVEAIPAAGRHNIVWLASYPKSGNTWVRVFLHNLIRELRGETEGSQDINNLGRFAIWEHSLPHFTKVLGKPPVQATMEEVARARPQVQRLLSAEQPRFALAKTHLCYGRDHGFPTIEPSVTKAAVYIVRDPRDVTISYAHHCGKSIDAIIRDMATPAFHIGATDTHVSETVGSWSQHVTSWLQPKPFPVHLVRYEDLLAKPKETFGALARFLDLNASEAQLGAAIQKSSFNELRKQEQARGFAERPKSARQFFRKGRAGEWRRTLSPRHIEEIKSGHGLVAKQLGYWP